MKAGPAPDSGFLPESDRMAEQRDRFPFHRVWVSPTYNRETYTEVLIKPVDTDYLMEMNWWGKISIKAGKMRQDAAKLAVYAGDSLQEAVRSDPKNRYDLVSVAGRKTLVIEMAIVELVPTKAELNALGTAAGVVVPGAGTAASLAGQGSIAIEMRFRDGGTREIVAMFADREKAKSAPVNLRGFTWYKFAEEILDDWSEQLIELANTAPEETVSDTSPFRLKPW